MQNTILKTLCFLSLLILSPFVLAQTSASSLASKITEAMRPLDTTLQALDKAHLSKLGYNELKVVLPQNQALQKDVYERMINVRNLIFKYSEISTTEKEIDQLKLFLTDYHEKLVRVVAIFFNYHSQYGNFPTMAQIRSMNAQVAKKSFTMIMDLTNMKAKHLSDDKIEILIKEIEYVQIASTTYMSNANASKADFGHLVQFIATQQTLVNRGQLSKLDANNVISESAVNQCMPGNLYLSEQKNYKVSQHELNLEDERTLFYSEYVQALNKVIPELIRGDYLSDKAALKIAQIMKSNGIAAQFFNKDFAIQVINSFAAEINNKLNEKELATGTRPSVKSMVSELEVDADLVGSVDNVISVKFFEYDTEENQTKRLNAHYKSIEEQLATILKQTINSFFQNQEQIGVIPVAFLNGDKLSLEEFANRARKSYELELYNLFGDIIRQLEGIKTEYIDLKAYALQITSVMDIWENEFKSLMNKNIKSFSLSYKSKATAHKEFIEQELFKAYPYMKDIYFSRFAEKAGDDLETVFASHKLKSKMTIHPSSPYDLVAITQNSEYLDKESTCPKVDKPLASNLQDEIADRFNELAPFIELMDANPNDYFSVIDGAVVLDEKALDQRVFANLGEFLEKRNYAADLKYQPSLMKQIIELQTYAQTGDKNYLSPLMKRYLTARSYKGKYSQNTAKEMLTVMANREVKNSVKENLSDEQIFSEMADLQVKKENLLWNITLWKLAEYRKKLGMTAVPQKVDFSKLNLNTYPKNMAEADQQYDIKKSCKVAVHSGGQNNTPLSYNVSSYTAEQVKITTHYVKGKLQPAPQWFKRDESIFKPGTSSMQTADGQTILLGITAYQNYYSQSMRSLVYRLGSFWGVNEALSSPFVAKGNQKHGFKLPAESQKYVAKNHMNQLFATSLLMRTPYKLGTTTKDIPTAYRLLQAYSIESSNELNMTTAKNVLSDTVRQALVNSQQLAEKWCQATFNRVSGTGNTAFNEVYRYSPLIREQLIEEMDLIQKRRAPSDKKFIEALRKVDEKLDSDTKSAGERLHDAIEMASMILGVIMLAALALTGIGMVASAWVGATWATTAITTVAAAGMKLTMSSIVFSLFIVSFASRMHHLYFRVPATLNNQYKIATTQIIKPIYVNWDELESKIAENVDSRTSGWSITAHVAEGAMQGLFAFQIAKVGFNRYSVGTLRSLLKKWNLPEIAIMKPLSKVKFKNIFRIKNLKGNLKSLKNLTSNGVTKLFNRKEFLIGTLEKHKDFVLQTAMKYRTMAIMAEHGIGETQVLNYAAKLSKQLKDVKAVEEIVTEAGERIIRNVSKAKTVKVKVTNLEEVAGEFKATHDEVIEILASNSRKERASLFTQIKESTSKYFASVSKSWKERAFMSRAKVKAWMAGDFKLWNNPNIAKLNNQKTEIKEAFEEVLEAASREKNANRQRMLDKINNAVAAEKEAMGADIISDSHLMERLFGEGPAAFNQGEMMEFVGYIMTSPKSGSLRAKWDFLMMMANDYPVLQSRLYTRAMSSGTQMPKEMYTLLKGVEGASEAGSRAKSLDDMVREADEVLGSAKTGDSKVEGATQNATHLSTQQSTHFNDGPPIYNATKLSEKVDALVEQLWRSKSAKSKERIAQGTFITLSMIFTGYFFQEEISDMFEELKASWRELTGETWAGLEFILSMNDFDQVITDIKSSDLMNEADLDAFIKTFEKDIRAGFATLEDINTQRAEFESDEDVMKTVEAGIDSLVDEGASDVLDENDAYEQDKKTKSAELLQIKKEAQEDGYYESIKDTIENAENILNHN